MLRDWLNWCTCLGGNLKNHNFNFLDISVMRIKTFLDLPQISTVLKARFILIQLLPKLHTLDFPPLCNQKFVQIKILKFSINKNQSLGLCTFLVAGRRKITSVKFWHQRNQDKPTVNNRVPDQSFETLIKNKSDI